MAFCPRVTSYEVTSSATGPVNIATVTIPYPSAVSAGDLLLMSVVRGDPISVTDTSPAVSGWALLTHQWGANNFLHNTYIRAADGTETGSVSVVHSDARASTGVMVCLRRATGSAFDGGAVSSSTTGTTITAPTLTPTNAPPLLIYFSGVPLGARGVNYSSDGMCLLGGADGGVYQPSNQAYAEVLATTEPSGTRSWAGAEAGAVSPWRAYAGGLIPWGANGPTVGFIGSGTF